MTLKRIVTAVEALALAAALVFVVMLFANEGGGTLSPGAAIYDSSCAACHGGDGGGGLGPTLAGEVTKSFPDIEDQIAFVSEGVHAAGRIPKKLYATASSPIEGLIATAPVATAAS